LKEASGYLERLTEGHYTRIWTKLVGEELLVDNEDDETITVDKLSRGTREAVYLSLRLALVTVYARRGAVLPMVLDDILVNFDAQRMKSAAKLLVEFSRNGYQILMFTCHEHMSQLFHSLDAEVLILPQHREVVEQGARPTKYLPARTQPTPVAAPIPAVPPPVIVEVRNSNLQIDADDYDPELEFELSAVGIDQRSHKRLRNELVYVNNDEHEEVDLSGDEEFWNENQSRATA
jgi:hypothetical protein